ncbi:MAG: hypothetical protein K9L64_06655 [Candidatus Izimaplasma sp.]|nr:hypothetical protein [Candidatus Izimaplasma bacterium]
MKDKAQEKKYHTDNYKKKLDKSYSDELSFFEEFYSSINELAHKNRQISINNLKESQKSLDNLRKNAERITESIINHDEHMIVEKQKIIRDSLSKIHDNNYKIYTHENINLNKNVFASESFFNNLLELNQDFFESYKFFLSSSFGTIDNIYAYLDKKNESFDYVINKHYSEIQDECAKLNQKITEIDESIKHLMTAKKQKEDILDEFFNVEIKNLIENQINVSINSNPYSPEIKAITENHIYQYEQFKKHLQTQEERLETKLKTEIYNIYQEHYNEIYNKTNNNKKAVKYANKKSKDIIKDNKAILYHFKKENTETLYDMKKYLDLYLNIYKTDPFLAQLLADNLSESISDEADFTRLYKMNKSQKYNLYFTYKLTELNHEIKLMEFNLIHFIKKKFIEQEIDITNIVFDVNSFSIEQKSNIETARIALKRDKIYLTYLNELFEVYLQNLLNNDQIDRTFLHKFSDYLNQFIREQESLDLKLVSATSDIKLALKESSIETLHIRNLYENEKRYLLIQQNRLKSETDINYEFILTTYKNQMRFAKEQIKLADEELKMRLNSIIQSIDSERDHFYKLIDEEVKDKEKQANSRFASYQKNVYLLIEQLESEESSIKINKIRKQLDKLRKEYRKDIDIIIQKYIENPKINLYNKRLQELDMYLEEAYLNSSELFDETVKEMDEIYRYAEEKYNYIIENVDKESYPLDDFLYKSLQDMKKRLNYRLKYVEISLYEKIHDKIDDYKQIYFKNQNNFNSKDILNLLNEYQEDKNKLKLDYKNKTDELNNNHLLDIENFNQEIFDVQLEYNDKKQDIISRKKTIINSKTNDLNKKDLHFKNFLQTVRNKHKFSLNNLIVNYYYNTENNANFYKSLNSEYQQLIDNYKDYINYSKKSKSIKKVIRKTKRQNKKTKKKELHSLKSSIKKHNLI